MKNRRFRNFISLLLIASPLWWTSGCYSSLQITNPADVAGTAIEITTKGNHHHTLKEWSVDSSGNISGSGAFVVPLTVRSIGGTVKQQPSTFIPKDSIAAIHVQRVNVGSTALIVIIATAGAVAVAYVLFCLSAANAYLD
jgi:hypothetical protein